MTETPLGISLLCFCCFAAGFILGVLFSMKVLL